IGDFSDAQRRVVALTADYVERFFGLPVKTPDPLPLAAVPANARRRHPGSGIEQLRTTYLLDLLAAHRPDDALGVLGLTAQKLCLARGYDPRTHFERPAVFAAKNGFAEERAFFERAREILAGAQ